MPSQLQNTRDHRFDIRRGINFPFAADWGLFRWWLFDLRSKRHNKAHANWCFNWCDWFLHHRGVQCTIAGLYASLNIVSLFGRKMQIIARPNDSHSCCVCSFSWVVSSLGRKKFKANFYFRAMLKFKIFCFSSNYFLWLHEQIFRFDLHTRNSFFISSNEQLITHFSTFDYINSPSHL